MDKPLGCLLQLIWLPYQIWKAIAERSVMGTSEMDREAGRLWKNFAIIGSIILIGVVVFIIWLIKNNR